MKYQSIMCIHINKGGWRDNCSEIHISLKINKKIARHYDYYIHGSHQLLILSLSGIKFQLGLHLFMRWLRSKFCKWNFAYQEHQKWDKSHARNCASFIQQNCPKCLKKKRMISKFKRFLKKKSWCNSSYLFKYLLIYHIFII